MKFFQHQKVLCLGTILAAFSIGTVFAEEPTMVERVQEILHPETEATTAYGYHHRRGCGEVRGCDNYRNCDQYGQRRHHHHYSEAELADLRAARQEQIRVAMDQLTPDQRREVEKFIAKDRKQRHERRLALQKMTSDQREAVRAHYYIQQRGYSHGNYNCYNR